MSRAYKLDITTQLTFDGAETCRGRIAARLTQTDASAAQPSAEELTEAQRQLWDFAEEADTNISFVRINRSSRRALFEDSKAHLKTAVEAAATRTFEVYDWIDQSAAADDASLLVECQATQDASHVYRESTWRAEWVPVTLPDNTGQSVPTNNELEYERMVQTGLYTEEELAEERTILGLD